MKKTVFFLTFFCLWGLTGRAQLRERERVTIDMGGYSCIMLSVYDVRILDTKMDRLDREKYALDSVRVQIVSPQTKVDLLTGKRGGVNTDVVFRSKELRFVLSLPGYETLDTVWKVTTLTPVLEAFLTREEVSEER